MGKTKNLVKIILRTELKQLQDSVQAAVEETGHLECDINTNVTWKEFLGNKAINLGVQHVLKSCMGSIVTTGSAKVAEHMRQFKKLRSCYVVQIMQNKQGRVSTKPTSSSALKVKSKGKSVNVKAFKASTSAGSLKRRGPLKGSKRPTPKRGKGNIKTQIPSTSRIFVSSVDNGNRSSSIPIAPFPHNFGMPQTQRGEDDEMQAESQCSEFTLSQDDIPVDATYDVKARVVECMVRNLNNRMLMNMKAEIDNLKHAGRWLRLTSHMPTVGNMLSEMFAERHFKP